ncbi:MAG: hypothetical protein ACXWD8_13815, partial [Mycobacterium sp.]
VGRIISSAALLLTITLLSFANGLSFMKMFGIGTALAIVIDATVIRGVVVPAFLRVAGDLNWWAPRPLKWLHARIGFSEAPSDSEIAPPTPQRDEEKQALTPIGAPEPDTIRHPKPAPQQDEKTVRLTPMGAPEPDTIRHARPTPQQDEETQQLTPTRPPEPDTIRHPKPAPQRDEKTVRLTPMGAPEPDTVRYPKPAKIQRQQRRYIVLEDNSRFDIDGDCLIGCAPHKSDAVQLGLRPIRI